MHLPGMSWMYLWKGYPRSLFRTLQSAIRVRNRWMGLAVSTSRVHQDGSVLSRNRTPSVVRQKKMRTVRDISDSCQIVVPGCIVLGKAASLTEACKLPKDRGNCDKYELRFYYNSEVKECKYFFYGGCAGNANNFKELAECERVCGKGMQATLVLKMLQVHYYSLQVLKQAAQSRAKPTPAIQVAKISQPLHSFRTLLYYQPSHRLLNPPHRALPRMKPRVLRCQ